MKGDASPEFLTTIGLEVHAQLSTRTKIFCGCEVRFGSPPNTLVCPVCLGLPGVLPVLNREVFLLGLRAVLAFGGAPSKLIKFDRKNYYYPDLPKGYQISQYDAPLGRGGFVEIETSGGPKRIRLNRIHLEEDAGKLIHDAAADSSLVDLNRAGVPLIEMVSEPDLESPDDAHAYLSTLKSVLKTIGVSLCDMEKGHLRCDANVSVRRAGDAVLGKKVEVKNMNSFKAVKAALQYEIGRQTEALGKGEGLYQETRLWDEAKGMTFLMRSKEEAHDYRYFPEPDLVPFFVTQEQIEAERRRIPELPRQKAARFASAYGLSAYDANLLTQDEEPAEFFETCAKIYPDYKGLANWMTGPVSAYLNEKAVSLSQTRLCPETLVGLLQLVKEGSLSLQAAREKVFPEVVGDGRDPKEVMEKKGLLQVSDEAALDEWVAEAIRSNSKVVNDFKSGKETAAMFLVGQVMRKSGGKANPGKVQELVRKRLLETAGPA
ncbi:MAG: Asp-tRNA(Asn)/Glu-tRNA(Gln) amidotransferase subunit GatB [Candidatus Omnitrophica bacterium]|nr:Asp-tRNA(Asn)/Glu-tRNA(Gln) amidotransferase subunit GatB [Candidatus Omnitrophota bacterium]